MAAEDIDEDDLLAGMEVRPRLKRRSVGVGGKQVCVLMLCLCLCLCLVCACVCVREK
jgi:hypothetical protein